MSVVAPVVAAVPPKQAGHLKSWPLQIVQVLDPPMPVSSRLRRSGKRKRTLETLESEGSVKPPPSQEAEATGLHCSAVQPLVVPAVNHPCSVPPTRY